MPYVPPYIRDAKNARLIAAILTGLIAVSLCSSAVYILYYDARFAASDVETINAVVEHEWKMPNKNTYNYYVDLRYDADSDTYQARKEISGETAKALQVGGIVPLKYLKYSPQTCRIDLASEETKTARIFKFLLYGGIFFALVFGYCVQQYFQFVRSKPELN